MGNCKRCGKEIENNNNVCNECEVKEKERIITVANFIVFLGEVLMFELLLDTPSLIFYFSIPAIIYFVFRIIIFMRKILKFKSTVLLIVNMYIIFYGHSLYIFFRFVIGVFNALRYIGEYWG